MKLTFRLAFRLDQLAVWVAPIPSAWLLVLLDLPSPSSYISADSLGRTWVTFRLAFRPYQLADGPTRPSYPVYPVPDSFDGLC